MAFHPMDKLAEVNRKYLPIYSDFISLYFFIRLNNLDTVSYNQKTYSILSQYQIKIGMQSTRSESSLVVNGPAINFQLLEGFSLDLHHHMSTTKIIESEMMRLYQCSKNHILTVSIFEQQKFLKIIYQRSRRDEITIWNAVKEKIALQKNEKMLFLSDTLNKDQIISKCTIENSNLQEIVRKMQRQHDRQLREKQKQIDLLQQQMSSPKQMSTRDLLGMIRENMKEFRKPLDSEEGHWFDQIVEKYEYNIGLLHHFESSDDQILKKMEEVSLYRQLHSDTEQNHENIIQLPQ